MAQVERAAKKSAGSRILGMLNPIRDPSLLVGLILTLIEQGNPTASPVKWLIFALLNWVAVKAIIWLLVNFAFSFVYLARKGGWVARHPRLAWRLLDALGTEEIIIGGLRPDMFATEDGSLHEGQLGYAAMGVPGSYGGMLTGARYQGPEAAQQDYGDYQQNGYGEYGRAPAPSMRLDEQSEELQDLLATYARLIDDWMSYTEEKWRAVSDSQLGWKPLRGRWNGWEEIYSDSFGADQEDATANDPMQRRFENAQGKGSAASAVACFMHDLDRLRQHMVALEGNDLADAARLGGFAPQQPVSQRSVKAPIIRNPMIVDAD